MLNAIEDNINVHKKDAFIIKEKYWMKRMTEYERRGKCMEGQKRTKNFFLNYSRKKGKYVNGRVIVLLCYLYSKFLNSGSTILHILCILYAYYPYIICINKFCFAHLA